MTAASERFVDVPRGRFRVLEWSGPEPAAVLLHGLTAVAESWLPTVSRLEPRRIIAIEQRGHGRSVQAAPDPSARALAEDVFAVVEALALERAHLAGHSMGARVAMVAASLRQGLFRSVAFIDIGPEAWRQNWIDTVAALDRMSDTLPAGQPEAIVARRGFDAETAEAFFARFERQADGTNRALGSREAMKAIVRAHRSRHYWREWEALEIPALFVRGGKSEEVRPRIAEEMRRRNGRVNFAEIAESGHNIPLEAPVALAAELAAFWATLER